MYYDKYISLFVSVLHADLFPGRFVWLQPAKAQELAVYSIGVSWWGVIGTFSKGFQIRCHDRGSSGCLLDGSGFVSISSKKSL